MREITLQRTTRETDITLALHLDGSGRFSGSSGIGFFDHMLSAFAVHSGMDLSLQMTGDLKVDCHHSVEDVGIVLGQALGRLADKNAIQRYGSFFIPMDESLAFCSLDLGGRPFLVFDAAFQNPAVGQFDCCMTGEFFRAVAMQAGMTLHLRLLYGENDHHKIEALFKAFAHALRQAVAPKQGGPLSSKGVLG
ncbi:MAG TPA: imidazoleglycerol-phosphate dehydratase HisB [Candidatus Anaerotruncus excrementipullorum]|uniref:Imidazoleglycerol-phosphate dehydratase n=1 Tax=Candidatus Anaerotruncus excrementipullorum TaxID=2838465 RepID=A0A9D1WQ64_9FIRM|nr:imidazoleglycerol-phosphate dehydratase HisB [Candidatus Anaerotruncus excrementipullorum]